VNHRARGELVKSLELLEHLNRALTLDLNPTERGAFSRARTVALEDASRAAKDFTADAGTSPETPEARALLREVT
jgi:hypothetical protein